MESIVKEIQLPAVTRLTTVYPISLQLSLETVDNDIVESTATVYLKGANTQNGLTKINARVVFNILHTVEGEICSYESATEVTFDISDSIITENSLAYIDLNCEEVKVKHGDNGTEAFAEIFACGYYSTPKSVNFLQDIEGAVVKKEEITALSQKQICNAEMQADGEKECSYYLEKVLYHKDSARVINAVCGVGEVIVEGEILSELLVLKKSGEKAFENLVTPFRYEVECEGVSPTDRAISFLTFCDCAFKITSEQESQSAQITAEYALKIFAMIFEESAVNCVIDGFSTTNELFLESNSISLVTNALSFASKHKCFGESDLALEKSDKIIACLYSNCEGVTFSKKGKETVVTGAVCCKVLYVSESGKISSEKALLPFSIKTEGETLPALSVIRGKNAVARNSEGKCFIDCELVLELVCFSEEEKQTVVSCEVGEEREQKTSAISVVFISAGDDLWTVCKKAMASEQVILSDNPDITFPASSDKAVLVYRKL